jgi:hypothetical protein
MRHWINLRNLTTEDRAVLWLFCGASACLLFGWPLVDRLQAFVAY